MESIRKIIAPTAMVALLVLGLTGSPSPARAGSMAFDVTIDTTGLSSPGFLEFSMSAATYPVGGTPSVMATIADVTFSGGGSAGSVSAPIGNTSGSLASTVIIDNGQYSDFQQALTYGTSISFVLTLSGSEVGDPTATSGTDFAMLVENSSGQGLNTGLAGEALDFYFPPLLGMEYQTFGPSTGSTPVVTLSGAAVPEPSSIALLGLGIGAIAATSRLRRRRIA